ncbi:MAG TPA: TlpA disulfide reductase family protein [Baekduia sp.]|nr:TlpA disulfide reductase family protein [Baekduia sp.]
MSDGGGRDRGPLDFDEDDEDRAAEERSPLVGAPPAQRAATAPAERPPRRPAAVPAMRYLWVVGAAAVVLVLVLLVSTIQHGTGRGARGVPPGEVMPAFAVPIATSDLDGDANIAQHAGEGQAGRRPACAVRGPDVLNGCALREAGPVVLAFFTVRNRGCVAEIDAMQAARAKLPGVQMAAIAIRGDRGDLRDLVRRHGWTFPVGYDRDGALANAYHVQVCPQLTFARRGGRVMETTFGALAPDELVVKARRLDGA